ncbi:MAG: biotin--[acetyl-CoA-carboxylase] ligase [Proteobacteria bacterium]|nr:MAG: biotin--[acetyl-CoA-carboxylase] ligase [Pseudomonadota bacterium]
MNYIENIPSTHLYVVQGLKKGNIKPPYFLYANNQYEGIGSRSNAWLGERGNLYMSFCIEEKDLPSDVPSPSVCIYFACIMKGVLENKGSQVWLKWPNDFYVLDKKIGGVMSSKIGDKYVVSMGLNLLSSPSEFGILDVRVTNGELMKKFCQELKINYSWKQVFSKFRIEFQKNKNFTFHKDGKVFSLEEAVLCDDGSIKLNGRRAYGLR